MAEIAWRKIVCPVDFSEESRSALTIAVDLCRRFGATLTLLHVRVREEVRVGPHVETKGNLDDLLREAEKAGLSGVKREEIDGDPRLAITEYAQKSGVDLVVMGTHGRTGRERAMMGSVAENTVRTARCPVLVVHPGWRPTLE